MSADDVRAVDPTRGARTVRVLRVLVTGAVVVAVVGGAVGSLAYWAEPTCDDTGDLRGTVLYPGGIGYGAMLVALAGGGVLLLVGLWSAPRGGWWKTLLLLPIGIAVTAVWLFIAIFSCWE